MTGYRERRTALEHVELHSDCPGGDDNRLSVVVSGDLLGEVAIDTERPFQDAAEFARIAIERGALEDRQISSLATGMMRRAGLLAATSRLTRISLWWPAGAEKNRLVRSFWLGSRRMPLLPVFGLASLFERPPGCPDSRPRSPRLWSAFARRPPQ